MRLSAAVVLTPRACGAFVWWRSQHRWLTRVTTTMMTPAGRRCHQVRGWASHGATWRDVARPRGGLRRRDHNHSPVFGALVSSSAPTYDEDADDTPKIKKPQWLVIDGTHLMYRCFYAMPPSLTRPRDGLPIGAVLGVSNALWQTALPYALRGATVVFAVDSRDKTKSWRAQLSSDYKATRPRMPDQLIKQTELVADAARAFGALVVAVEGQEADDIIATLASRHAAEGVDVWSGDKDLLQLVGNGVRVLQDMAKKKNNGPKGFDEKRVLASDADVREAFGVDAAQIADYLALVGDASDNVPGIKGVGPKTAVKLLSEYGTLDEVLKEAPESPVVGKAMRAKFAAANYDDVRLSRRLVDLDTDVPLPDDLLLSSNDNNSQADENAAFDWDRLLHFADEHGFEALRRRVQEARAAAVSRQNQAAATMSE